MDYIIREDVYKRQTLEGLEVGTQYKLVGWQMLKEENAELLINGKRVESDYTFIADSETMKVEVAFTFDATSDVYKRQIYCIWPASVSVEALPPPARELLSQQASPCS